MYKNPQSYLSILALVFSSFPRETPKQCEQWVAIQCNLDQQTTNLINRLYTYTHTHIYIYIYAHTLTLHPFSVILFKLLNT